MTTRARVDAASVSFFSASRPVRAAAFVCTITGTPVSVAATATACEDARDVADDPVALDRALQERRLDPGVVDALGISRTNSDAIALVGRYARNPGSSRNA